MGTDFIPFQPAEKAGSVSLVVIAPAHGTEGLVQELTEMLLSRVGTSRTGGKYV